MRYDVLNTEDLHTKKGDGRWWGVEGAVRTRAPRLQCCARTHVTLTQRGKKKNHGQIMVMLPFMKLKGPQVQEQH